MKSFLLPSLLLAGLLLSASLSFGDEYTIRVSKQKVWPQNEAESEAKEFFVKTVDVRLLKAATINPKIKFETGVVSYELEIISWDPDGRGAMNINVYSLQQSRFNTGAGRICHLSGFTGKGGTFYFNDQWAEVVAYQFGVVITKR